MQAPSQSGACLTAGARAELRARGKWAGPWSPVLRFGSGRVLAHTRRVLLASAAASHARRRWRSSRRAGVASRFCLWRADDPCFIFDPAHQPGVGLLYVCGMKERVLGGLQLVAQLSSSSDSTPDSFGLRAFADQGSDSFARFLQRHCLIVARRRGFQRVIEAGLGGWATLNSGALSRVARCLCAMLQMKVFPMFDWRNMAVWPTSSVHCPPSAAGGAG